jgi:4-diphosphocytidyl-2-C-methyl-D-erythritol kinase
MYLARRGKRIEAWAPAKLNLFLEIRGRRCDGYHEIETLMVAINLFDTLYFQAVSEKSLRLSSRWVAGYPQGRVAAESAEDRPALGDIPAGAENSAYRAVEQLRRRAGIEEGARLVLVKRIPSAAGLGGASSDAAAALVAANEGWRLGWPRERLAEIAADVGSDVPFFLHAGTAVCRGRGEKVSPVPFARRLHFVVIRPPAGLATADVYRRVVPPENPVAIEPLVDALERGAVAMAGARLVNRLESAATALSPWPERLRDALGRLGLPGWGMTGSGSSYFGLCRHARHARRMAEALRGWQPGGVFTAASLPGMTHPVRCPDVT